METDALRELLTLAEKRSYAAAADALFISASTLSRHVATMESQLGVTLFHRNSRSVLVTQQGNMLLSYARKITALEDEYREKLDKAKRAEGAGVRIGTSFELSSGALMSKFAGFLRENRECSLALRREEPGGLLDMLREGKYDFALVLEEGPSFEDEFSRMTVMIDQLAAVLPQDHLLAQAQSVRLTQLQKEEFLLQPVQPVIQRLMSEAFHRAGYTPSRTPLEVSGVAVTELVAHGLGVALEQERIMRETHCPDVAVVPLDPPERIWINLVWRPDDVTTAGKTFIAHFRDMAAGKTTQLEKISL